MKSKKKKRILALALCMVMVLGGKLSVLADDTNTPNTEPANIVEEVSENTAPEPETVVTAEPAPLAESEDASEEENVQTEAAPAAIEEEPDTTQENEPATASEIAETPVAEEPTASASENDSEEPAAHAEEPVAEENIEPQASALTMKFENDDVIITVGAEKEGVIPENAKLQVVPILSDDKETEDQYKEVEEELNKKAENEAYDIAGFLAYDISFVDEAGNKVEPNGEVKVTMDYKKAAVPEGMDAEAAKDADVTVMHLEEDHTGKVKEVVDMVADDAIEATVETTDDSEVKNAEFTTKSFSVYTVTWTISSKSVKLTAHYGYEEGGQFKEFKEEATKKLQTITTDKTSDNVRLAGYNNTDVFQKDGYTFQNTYISENNNYGNKKESTHLKLTRKGGKNNYTYFLQTSTNGTDFIDYGYQLTNTTRNVDVYYVYKKIDKLTTVETVDHTKDGIIMRMIDYGSAANGIDIGGSYGDGNIKGTIKKDLVQSQLRNGYPITTKGSRSLSSLFEGGETVNHLFRKDIYDSTGYYEYNCFENYAYLNGTNFEVYNQIGTPSDDVGDANETRYYYKRGNFMPYNQIKEGAYSKNHNLYDEDGNALPEDAPRYNEPLYRTQGENFYFGMYMEARFFQAKGGQVNYNGSNVPMRYEFNGDDDMWIFIDNVLVLDIGGIHDAHSGYIDFATGEVGWKDCKTGDTPVLHTTTIKKMFQEAGVFPDGSKWNDTRVDEYFKGNTFIDYSAHTFKMFYMERGRGASNLHMKFNLYVIPSGEIKVSKELSNTDKEKYANEDFTFQLHLQDKADRFDPQNPKYKDTYSIYKDGEEITAQLVKVDGTKEPLTIREDGTFTLKHGQSAIFNGDDLKENRKYYVVETGVESEEFDKVFINNTTVTTSNETEKNGVESTKDSVGNRPWVTFTNNCSAANLRELRITKKMNGLQQTDDTFSFKVMLSDPNGELIPYANDDYYLKDKDGNYWYYENGVLKSNGTTAKVCGKTNDEGVISGVKPDFTVVITSILSGTLFRVEEVNLDQNKYSDPEIVVSPQSSGNAEEGVASGTIELGSDKDVEVMVINSLLDSDDTPYIEVQKTFVGLTNPKEEVADFEINLYRDKECTQLVKKLTLKDTTGLSVNADGTVFTWKIDSLEAGTYYLKEVNLDADGYTLTTITVNGTEVSADSVIEVTTQTAEYEFSKFEEIKNNNWTSQEFDDCNFIAGSLTTGRGEFFVWTEDTLSAGERQAIVNALKTKESLTGNWDSITEQNTVFFSTWDRLEKGITYKGTINVTEENNKKLLHFQSATGGKNQWQKVCIGSYEKTGTVNADIEVTNTYIENKVTIDLQKYGSSFEGNQLSGAKFSLYKGTKNGLKMEWGLTPINGYANFDITENNLKELELSTGYYKLVETVAPEGYQLLDKPIYFKVERGVVTLIDKEGAAITPAPDDMWELTGTKPTFMLKIKNTVLYELPSSGGIGIYWYMIGGMLIMMAAALILYINKRKEVLRG